MAPFLQESISFPNKFQMKQQKDHKLSQKLDVTEDTYG